MAGARKTNRYGNSRSLPVNESIGIGATKRFSKVHVVRDDSATAWVSRIEDNDPATYQSLGHQPGGSCKAVFEASMNWNVLHDTLSSIVGIEMVVVHPRRRNRRR